MSEIGWDKTSSQHKVTCLISSDETAARIVELLQFLGWETDKPSVLSGGCRITATKWVSRTSELQPLTDSGRKSIGAWKLLGRFPNQITENGIALTQYRYTFNAWILSSADKTLVDYSVKEEIDPLCKSLPDKFNFRLSSRLSENDPLKSIEHSVRIDAHPAKTGSVRIVSITDSGPQLRPSVALGLLNAA